MSVRRRYYAQVERSRRSLLRVVAECVGKVKLPGVQWHRSVVNWAEICLGLSTRFDSDRLQANPELLAHNNIVLMDDSEEVLGGCPRYQEPE